MTSATHREIVHQELTRLSAAVQRLEARAENSRFTLELLDGFDTLLELVFRHEGNYVRGRVRSRAGDADFELYGAHDRVAFKHPKLDHLSALRMPVDAYRGAASIRYSLSDEELGERVVKSARMLQHVALLKKVESGLGQRRRAASSPRIPSAA